MFSLPHTLLTQYFRYHNHVYIILFRVPQKSAFCTSISNLDKNDLGTPLEGYKRKPKPVPSTQEGYLGKSKVHQIKQEDFEAMKKQLDNSLGNAAMSFAICALVIYVYLIFKDENDRDIMSNLKMLRNEESICIDTIASILRSKPDKDALMFQRRLKDIREEIEMNEKKLEGLDLPNYK